MNYRQTTKFVAEIFDTQDVIQHQIDKLINLIHKSRHPILFTGAGVSTNSGIPDYRSTHETVLPTGPGRWENTENKLLFEQKKGKPNTKPAITCVPSYSHMAIEALRRSYFKQLVTQNVDNLHRKSGISDTIELHGNIQMERCSDCKKQYFRDYYVRPATREHSSDHFNGRYCDVQGCSGKLLDSLVFFTEPLDATVKERAFDEFESSDLCLVLGSSLRVNPAQRLPLILVKKNLPVFTVNLQKTALESHVHAIHTLTDQFLNILTSNLNLAIKPVVFNRNLTIELSRFSQYNEFQIGISGYDFDGQPFDFIQEVNICYVTSEHGQPEQGNLHLIAKLDQSNQKLESLTVYKIHSITFRMHGHYKEPDLFVSDEGLFQQMLQQSFDSKSNYVRVHLDLEYVPGNTSFKISAQRIEY